VTRAHLDSPLRDGAPCAVEIDGSLRQMVDRVETAAIQAALDRFDGNRRRAAEALGLSRPGLRYKLRRLGLEESPAR
jgi:two-component system response regulator HupR/HoxA